MKFTSSGNTGSTNTITADAIDIEVLKRCKDQGTFNFFFNFASNGTNNVDLGDISISNSVFDEMGLIAIYSDTSVSIGDLSIQTAIEFGHSAASSTNSFMLLEAGSLDVESITLNDANFLMSFLTQKKGSNSVTIQDLDITSSDN